VNQENLPAGLPVCRQAGPPKWRAGRAMEGQSSPRLDSVTRESDNFRFGRILVLEPKRGLFIMRRIRGLIFLGASILLVFTTGHLFLFGKWEKIVKPAVAWDTIDSFENSSLPGWQTLSGASGVKTCSDQFYHGGSSLCLRKPPDPEYIQLQKAISLTTNKKFSIRYFDNLENKGTYWGVENSSDGQYYMIGILSGSQSVNPNNYFVRYSDSSGNKLWFDTGILRTTGWHQFEIVVTELGTYARIDGFNTTYLGAVNGYRPLNNALTSIDKINLACTWNVTSNDYYDLLESEDIPAFSTVSQMSLKRLEDFTQKYKNDFLGPQGYSVNQIAIDNGNQLSRTASNLALALSVLCLNKGEDYCPDSLALSNKVRLSYYEPGNQWKAVDSSNPNFKYNTSPLTLYPLLLTAWLNRNRVTIGEYNNYLSIFEAEANWFTIHNLIDQLPSYPGNTSSETIAWTGAFLSLAGKAYQNSSWETMGNKYIEAALSERFVGSGFKLCNHYLCPHPGYALYTLASVAEAGLSYKLRGQPIPTTWKSGVDSLNLNSVNPYLVFNNRYYYSNFVHGVDDWHRTPVDSGISAFTLLKYFNLGVNDKLGKYVWFVSADYQAFPETGGLNISYQLDKYEVGQDINNVTKYVDGILNRHEIRRLINSTVALYDAVTYFYEANFLLPPFLPPASPSPSPLPTSSPTSIPTNTPTLAPQCTPGDTACCSDTQIRTCNSLRQWGSCQNCGLGQICLDNRCQTLSPTPTPIPGDLDKSGWVDGLDVIYLISYFGNLGACPACDLDHNGRVDGLDVIMLIGYL